MNTPRQDEPKDADSERVIVIPLPRRFVVGLLVGGVLVGTVFALLLAWQVFVRVAPEESPEAMAALVAWVWLYHIVEIFRRRQKVRRGLLRALAFAVLATVVIGTALYLAYAYVTNADGTKTSLARELLIRPTPTARSD